MTETYRTDHGGERVQLWANARQQAMLRAIAAELGTDKLGTAARRILDDYEAARDAARQYASVLRAEGHRGRHKDCPACEVVRRAKVLV